MGSRTSNMGSHIQPDMSHSRSCTTIFTTVHRPIFDILHTSLLTLGSTQGHMMMTSCINHLTLSASVFHACVTMLTSSPSPIRHVITAASSISPFNVTQLKDQG